MDELENKAQKGLESFSQNGDVKSVKLELDGHIDDMLGEDDENSKAKARGKISNWVYIGLAIIGLSLIGYLGYKDGSKKETFKEAPVLYAQYFDVLPDALSANERGSNDDGENESDVNLAMEYYNNGDYSRAAILLKQQDELDYLVFGAIAEMKNENHASAIDLLLKSKELDQASKYKDVIDWYLALAYLQQGEIDKAKIYLSSISKGQHYKKEEAKSILKFLK